MVKNDSPSFFRFMEKRIADHLERNRMRTAESYVSTLNSLRRFTSGIDLYFNEINAALAIDYEMYLKKTGVSRNTSSFYMRIFRATFNRAVNMGLVEPPSIPPFALVYTGIPKTMKRAIDKETISRIRQLPLTKFMAFSRDMFLFSFYTRGMSFIDMAYLRKTDMADGFITYRRRKTGQKIVLRVEKELAELIARYPAPSNSIYLLPIITKEGANGRNEYLSRSHVINRHLKEIGRQAGTSLPLSMYMARHSWATLARNLNIPINVISEALGHESETTTKIYLSAINSSVIDSANHRILSSI